MLPRNELTPTPVVSGFIPPTDEVYDPLRESHRGGLGISDASKGRNTQNWQARYESGAINLYAGESLTPAYSLTVAGVLSLSLAFDNNMRPVFAYQSSAGAHLYFYDTIAEAYTTMSLAGVTSSRCCVDDVRDIYSEPSDVIWAYVRGDNVYWRQQRDRYLTEYPVGPAFEKTLVRVGQTHGRRLTFKLMYIDP